MKTPKDFEKFKGLAHHAKDSDPSLHFFKNTEIFEEMMDWVKRNHQETVKLRIVLSGLINHSSNLEEKEYTDAGYELLKKIGYHWYDKDEFTTAMQELGFSFDGNKWRREK